MEDNIKIDHRITECQSVDRNESAQDRVNDRLMCRILLLQADRAQPSSAVRLSVARGTATT